MATNRIQIPHYNENIGISAHFASLQFSHVDLNRGVAIFLLQPPDGSEAPEIPVRLSDIRPNTEEDREVVWYSLAGSLFERLRAQGLHPEFVRGYEVETGDDSTGDPALYVKILVTPTRGPADDATVTIRSEFSDRIQEALLQLHLQRYPYVQLGEWRRKR